MPVREPLIEAVHPFITPPIWAAIQFQLWTGCRPGEALDMRTCDIVADDPILPAAVRGLCWCYHPQSHKTEHYDKTRLILLGPQARAIIEPWLRPGEPEACLFSPAEARRWADQRRRKTATKKTRPAGQDRLPGSRYTVWSYARAIRRACERAAGMPANLIQIPRKLKGKERTAAIAAAKAWRKEHAKQLWHPNQLRHNAGTRIRAAYNLETARVILGHAKIATTEIYAEADIIRAAEAMAAVG
jgi:integrase